MLHKYFAQMYTHKSHQNNALTILLCTLALVCKINGEALSSSASTAYVLDAVQATSAAPELDANIDIAKVLQPEALIAKMVRFDKAKSGNLTAITWAHAVNNQQLLAEALSSDIEMIEADISLGKLNGEGEDLPVMAHPPANTSDLTLAAFLEQIKHYNEQHGGVEKGVKLDFKSIEVFEGSLGILDESIPKMNYPIWINADIIKGPVEQNTSVPVDPARFFAGCNRYKKAMLSIGWTTRWSSEPIEGEYTQAQCDEMLEVITSNNVLSTGQAITFPIRAGIGANSAPQLHELVAAVNETNDITLTIWGSENDYVDVERLRQLIFSFGLERVYLDVPDSLASKLDLGNTGGSSSTFASLMSFSFVSLCFWALSSYLKQSTL